MSHYHETNKVFKNSIVDNLARQNGVMRFKDHEINEYIKKAAIEFLEDVIFKTYQYNSFLKSEALRDERKDNGILEVISVTLGLRASKYNIQMVAGSQDKNFKGKMIKMSGSGEGKCKKNGEMRGGGGGGSNANIDKKIKHLQAKKGTNLLIEREPFKRLMKEIATKHAKKEDPKMKASAIDVLHHALEAYLGKLFNDAWLIRSYSKTQTMTAKDLALARYIHGEIFELDDEEI
jgi:histone H3/H4